jgi:putative transposase
MGIEEIITAARSPWQNPYAERLIGSIRRECLDHVIILNERHLRRVLSSYFQHHHDSRTHLSLNKDCPRPRRVQLPSVGKIIAFPEVGGLHHPLRASSCMTGAAAPCPHTIALQFIFEQKLEPAPVPPRK